MKRVLSIILVLLLALSLAGCGQRADAEPQEAEPEQNAVQQEPEEPEIVEPEPESIPEVIVPEPEQRIIEPEIIEPEPEPLPEPADTDFVLVRDYIPDICVELYYATDRNFTGQVIYDFTDAYLRYGTVKKLADAQERLHELGCGLKIWDAFRPVSAQFRLWEVCPDGRYVANPNRGYSSHSRGNTVDVTLVDLSGNELPMPTGFDNFTLKADRDYSDIEDVTAIANTQLLEEIMIVCGFEPYSAEWWHYADSDSYEVGTDFEP